jgi:hypothetical protein
MSLNESIEMPTHIMTKRGVGGKIVLSDWLDHVAKSGILKLNPPRKGINPFTKKPLEFHPAPGSSYFETPNGRCSIEFQTGQLVLRAEDDKALPIIQQIADSLGATFRMDETGDYGRE